jgi:hypothetical protein
LRARSGGESESLAGIHGDCRECPDLRQHSSDGCGPQPSKLGLDQEAQWHASTRSHGNFHRASPDDVTLHARSPRGNPAWPPTGTFVHRNHRRPNQLAQSFPRLLKIDGLDLHVTDLDAIDGTPIYDLAPYFTEMGPPSSNSGR